MTDFVVYGTVAWERAWLTEQNLAHALARAHRVLYVEPPITPVSPIRYGIRRSTFGEIRRLFPPLVNRVGSLEVARLLALPPLEHPRARRVSAPLLRRQVARLVRRLGIRSPIVIAARAMPEIAGAAGERASVFLIKDLVAAGGALLGRDVEAITAEERAMCEAADLVCAVTPQLQETFAARGFPTALLRHGFHADLAPLYDAAEPPAEYARLPRPLLGYGGRIDGRLDFDAIRALADRFREGSILMIGPVSPRLARAQLLDLVQRPNVHFLGPFARERLPAYLAHLDCILMPYREDEWGQHGSPLKLWDALYAGPPVVCSGYTILRNHPLVHFASPPGRLPDVAARALSENGAQCDARRAHAVENSWERRADEFEELLRERGLIA